MADRNEIRTLFKNLLDNAVRNTPTGGSVDIAIGRSADRIVLEVRDTGPGIAAVLLDRVFDRFFRAGGEGVEGSGLGLPIVRAIADRYGAIVTLHNRSDRSGLVARVSFQEAGRSTASLRPETGPTPVSQCLLVTTRSQGMLP